jgi:hypothetical protein
MVLFFISSFTGFCSFMCDSVLLFYMYYLGGIKSDTAAPETTGESPISGGEPAPSNVPETPTTPAIPGLPPCDNCKLRKQVAGKFSLFYLKTVVSTFVNFIGLLSACV